MNIAIDNTSMYLDFEDISIELQDANTNNTLDIIDVGVMESGQAYNNNKEVNLGALKTPKAYCFFYRKQKK